MTKKHSHTQEKTSQTNRKSAPAYEKDDGPLPLDYIAQLNAKAKKFIPVNEVPIETSSLFELSF